MNLENIRMINFRSINFFSLLLGSDNTTSGAADTGKEIVICYFDGTVTGTQVVRHQNLLGPTFDQKSN